MCRLFVQHASPDHDLREPLCTAHNALRTQSHVHPHGWGIGWYGPTGIRVRRGVMPAHADGDFVEAAREARSEIVVAHVRDASVGPVNELNTHPFLHGPWLFAHNGTVTRYKTHRRVRAAIEAAIDPRLRCAIRGDTDSERCFFLLLSKLMAIVPAGARPTLELVRAAMAETVASLVSIADGGAEKPSSLNFALSNGDVLAVCRHGRALHVASHLRSTGAFAVASEPIGRGPWSEVPEDGFVGIDAAHRIVAAPLGSPPLRSAV
jgi:glutamine amidotransferase